MSEAERPDRVLRGEPTVEDIRSLVGPSTPHFALQVRNRIRKLIEPLPADHPARIEGEKAIETLEALSRESGDPRQGIGT